MAYDHLLTLVDVFPHDKKCYVFSNTEKRQDEFVEFVSGNVVGLVNKLKKEEGLNIWLVGGVELTDQFIKENLVDEFIITIAPIVLGKGISLFKKGNPEKKLLLKESKRLGEFVQLHYLRE